jgi:hypothetical protein
MKLRLYRFSYSKPEARTSNTRGIDPDSGPSVGKKNSELPVYLSILGKAASSYIGPPFANIHQEKGPSIAVKHRYPVVVNMSRWINLPGVEVNGKMPDFGISQSGWGAFPIFAGACGLILISLLRSK